MKRQHFKPVQQQRLKTNNQQMQTSPEACISQEMEIYDLGCARTPRQVFPLTLEQSRFWPLSATPGTRSVSQASFSHGATRPFLG